MEITRQSLIGDVVERHPEVIDTLLGFGVHCVGCAVSPVEKLEDGFRGHGMTDNEVDEAVIKLNKVIESKEQDKGPEAGISDHKITLTENAIQKIIQVTKAQGKEALRIAVKKGGCAGMSYIFNLDDKATSQDVVLEEKGAKVFIDKESLELLDGSEVDYLDALQGAGFKIQNPNAKATCGCGSSFS